nr:hypothetical protein BaRGS_029116 [Batillaria attramentaria]
MLQRQLGMCCGVLRTQFGLYKYVQLESEDVSVGGVVGGVAAVIIVIAIAIVVGVIIFSGAGQKADEYEEEEDVYNTEDLYACYNTVSTKPQLDALQKYLLEALASGELSAQFGEFAKGMTLPHKDGMSEENVRKNRFKAMCACPRDTHVNDLWWMVWQEKATQVVMLTNLIEDGKAGERQVTQYHFNTWPDHGVPQAPALVDFWRYVKARGNPRVPLIVHCSAGVGRTGTFIALDIASELEAGGKEVNVQQIVIELREQRCIMVQSEMLEEMGKYRPKRSYRMANMKENVDKNRNQDAVPDDDHVVYLNVHVRGRNQYINAVYMSGENKVGEVQLLHYKDWAGELPDDMSSLIQLVDTVKAEDDASSPIVIQCIDGATKSGLFCAIYDIINRLMYDDEIDVYMTARYVQSIRPQAVSTEAQYRFLYKVAQEYISHLSVYQNTNVRA